MSIRKFLASSISATLVASVAIPAVSHADDIQFNDLKEGDSFYKEIMTLANDDIIKGYPTGEFKPYQPLMRGQVAKLFTRALKLETPENTNELLSTIEDVEPDSEFADVVAALMKEGIITKEEDGQFRPGAPLTREVMATWLVRAFKLQPDVNIPVTLTDLDVIDRKHLDNVMTLFQNGITTGKEDGSYMPNQAVNRGQFAAFMFRSIYQIEAISNPVDATYDISDAVLLPDNLPVTYTNGKAGEADISWNTNEYDLTIPGTYQLVGTISGSNKKASATVRIEDQPLMLKSVKALNLKQIELEFNHTRFNTGKLENENYYTLITGEGKKIRVIDAEVTGTKLLLTTESTLGNNDTSYLQLHKDILGSEVVNEVNSFDTTIPKIDKLEAISKTQVKVTFSEIMNFKTENGKKVTDYAISSAFELKEGTNSIKSITVQEHGKEAIIEFYSSLKENDYQLSINDSLRDYATFKLDQATFDFTMKYDKGAPVIKTVKDIYPNQYTVVFDKAITLYNKVKIESYFSHDQATGGASHVLQTAENEITVIFDQKNSLTETSKIMINKGAVLDLWGNENQLIEHEIIVINDKKGPEITSVEMIDEDKAANSYIQLKITYNEPTSSTLATEKANYSILDLTGNDIAIKRVELDSTNFTNSVYLITLDKQYGDFKNSTYTINAKQQIDLFNNQIDISTFSFAAGSEKAPGNFSANIITNDNQIRFIVDYNEAMQTSGPYSILDLIKYELRVADDAILLATLNEDENVTVAVNPYDSDSKAEIVITTDVNISGKNKQFIEQLSSAITNQQLYKVNLVLAMVADEDGNTTTSFSNNVSLRNDTTFTIADNGAIVVDQNTIHLSFDDQLNNLNLGDFIIFYDKNNNEKVDVGESLTKRDIDVMTAGNSTTLSITLSNELEYDGTYRSYPIYITTSEKTATTNRYGQKVNIDETLAVDKIVPKLAVSDGEQKVTVKAASEVGKAIVSLEFTEKIDPSTVTRLSFEVAGGLYPVESVEVKDKSLLLTVALNERQYTDLVGEYVWQLTPITDMSNNVVNNIETIIVD